MQDQDEITEAMTEESIGMAEEAAQKARMLAAMKSFDADVERAKYINELSLCVRREMCKTCKNDGCKEVGPNKKCILVSIASVVVGMIKEGGAQ